MIVRAAVIESLIVTRVVAVAAPRGGRAIRLAAVVSGRVHAAPLALGARRARVRGEHRSALLVGRADLPGGRVAAGSAGAAAAIGATALVGAVGGRRTGRALPGVEVADPEVVALELLAHADPAAAIAPALAPVAVRLAGLADPLLAIRVPGALPVHRATGPTTRVEAALELDPVAAHAGALLAAPLHAAEARGAGARALHAGPIEAVGLQTAAPLAGHTLTPVAVGVRTAGLWAADALPLDAELVGATAGRTRDALPVVARGRGRALLGARLDAARVEALEARRAVARPPAGVHPAAAVLAARALDADAVDAALVVRLVAGAAVIVLPAGLFDGVPDGVFDGHRRGRRSSAHA